MNYIEAEASADNLSGSSHGTISCAPSSPTTHRVPEPDATFLFSFSCLQPFRRYHSSQSTPRLAASSSDKRQCLKAPILPFVLVPTPLFMSATNLVPGGKAEFDTVDLLPRALVSTRVLTECSQSRDTELKAVNSFDGIKPS